MPNIRMKTSIITACLLLVSSTTLLAQTNKQDASKWDILLDENNMGNWDRLGDSNWRMQDGEVVVNEKKGNAPGYLVSKDSYTDFVLHIEFWASDNANSGIFFRCLDPLKINDRSCYEANIYDQRADPSYGTGAIVRHAEVNPMPKAGNKWNTYIITAKGRDLTVELNGQTTAKLRSGLFSEGPFAIQHGLGTIKLRKVMIKPL